MFPTRSKLLLIKKSCVPFRHILKKIQSCSFKYGGVQSGRSGETEKSVLMEQGIH